MNNKLILIVGLPGSGKSRLLKKQFSDSTKYRIFDDFKANAVIDCIDFTYSQNYPDIISEMKSSLRHIVISDIDFCNYKRYKRVIAILDWWIKNKGYSYCIKPIVFENDPAKCKNNVVKDKGRDMNSRIAMIQEYSRNYEPEKYVDSTKVRKICET